MAIPVTTSTSKLFVDEPESRDTDLSACVTQVILLWL